MSLTKFAKIVLSTLLVILLLLFIGGGFIGPGVGDFSEPIINDYEYSFSGGDGKMIVYVGKERQQGIIINARVDEYKAEGDNLLVARRPREVYFEQDGVPNTRLLPICEYWAIDTKKHTTLKSVDANGLHCK